MTADRFERVIYGSFKEQSALVDANVVIKDIDVRSNYGFTLEWDELGFLSAGPHEQNFTVTGATSGAVRDQAGTEASTTVFTTDNGQTVRWTVAERYDNDTNVGFTVKQQLGYGSDSKDGVYVYRGVSSSETLDGSSRDEKVFLNGGNDRYYSSDNGSIYNGGVDTVYGNSGNDSAVLYNRGIVDGAYTEKFAGHFDGGTGTDSLFVNGSYSDYDIYQHGDMFVFRNTNYDDASGLGRKIATAKDIEYFEGVQLTAANVKNGFDERAQETAGDRPDDLSNIRDFDGNDLGAGGDWKFIGKTDAQFDDDVEFIYVNNSIGR